MSKLQQDFWHPLFYVIHTGYLQIELEVVAENASAVRLYESVGFQEYGRNPRGFRARSGWQTLVLMRLELDS